MPTTRFAVAFPIAILRPVDEPQPAAQSPARRVASTPTRSATTRTASAGLSRLEQELLCRLRGAVASLLATGYAANGGSEAAGPDRPHGEGMKSSARWPRGGELHGDPAGGERQDIICLFYGQAELEAALRDDNSCRLFRVPHLAGASPSLFPWMPRQVLLRRLRLGPAAYPSQTVPVDDQRRAGGGPRPRLFPLCARRDIVPRTAF